MKIIKSVWVDKERNIRYMEPAKVISKQAEGLLRDYYQRKAKAGALFFGVDTGRYYSKLEDVSEDKFWRDHFDIDYILHFGASAEELTGLMYHEVKSFSRTLDRAVRTARDNGKKLPEGQLYHEEYELHERGIIQVEIVGNTEHLSKKKQYTVDVPDTEFKQKHSLGDGWTMKGNFPANYYHLYLPMGRMNGGRQEATTAEIEQMRQEAPAGAKLITEAPAGLFISLSRSVMREWIEIALEELAERHRDGQMLQERRAFLEEYFSEGEARGKNVRLHANTLVDAHERAMAKGSGVMAFLEVRPVFKFIRNQDGAEAEVEVADSASGYWMPSRFREVYYNEGGQFRRSIPGYWDDTRQTTITKDNQVISKRLLWELAFRLQGIHCVTMPEEEEADTETGGE